MKTELIEVLRKCDDVDISELSHVMRLVDWLKEIERQNGLTALQAAKNLGVSIDLYKNMRNGTYPFDLRTIARIEVVDHELKRKREAKFKTVK